MAIRTIMAEELREQMLARSVRIWDVREGVEVQQGILSTALNVPLVAVESQAPILLPDSTSELFVYCASGARSARALEILTQLGYSNVRHLVGGIARWQQLGYPLESSPQRTTDECATGGRYTRQVLLEQIGIQGQARLLGSRVLIVGLGGLGSPAALYLAGAGIGTLGLVDGDHVSLSNLHRQIIHSQKHLDCPKVQSAQQRLAEFNPDVKVETLPYRFDADNGRGILSEGWDAIVDGGDNFPLRYLLNDLAAERRITVCHGSVDRFEGRVTTFIANTGPCYRCLFPRPPAEGLIASCVERGVLGMLPGIIGTLQATEVIKVILGIGRPLSGRLLTYDALSMEFRTLRYDRDPACEVCSSRC